MTDVWLDNPIAHRALLGSLVLYTSAIELSGSIPVYFSNVSCLSGSVQQFAVRCHLQVVSITMRISRALCLDAISIRLKQAPILMIITLPSFRIGWRL
jgi:hypothetical protein